MSRELQDAALGVWEVFATTADGGTSVPGRIVFQSLAGPGRQLRVVEIDGDVADAERIVQSADDEELAGLLERCAALD